MPETVLMESGVATLDVNTKKDLQLVVQARRLLGVGIFSTLPVQEVLDLWWAEGFIQTMLMYISKTRSLVDSAPLQYCVFLQLYLFFLRYMFLKLVANVYLWSLVDRCDTSETSCDRVKLRDETITGYD